MIESTSLSMKNDNIVADSYILSSSRSSIGGEPVMILLY